jgi:hypothetical protein
LKRVVRESISKQQREVGSNSQIAVERLWINEHENLEEMDESEEMPMLARNGRKT